MLNRLSTLPFFYRVEGQLRIFFPQKDRAIRRFLLSPVLLGDTVCVYGAFSAINFEKTYQMFDMLILILQENICRAQFPWKLYLSIMDDLFAIHFNKTSSLQTSTLKKGPCAYPCMNRFEFYYQIFYMSILILQQNMFRAQIPWKLYLPINFQKQHFRVKLSCNLI